jgi:hypothetical protein
MIVFDLECRAAGHRFEGWFGSSEEFARQHDGGLVGCPQCGSADVVKALTAPRLGRKGNQIAVAPPRSDAAPVSVAEPAAPASTAAGLPPEAPARLEALARLQAAMLENSRWVGDSFAESVRAMHYGEHDRETVHGQASLGEARELLEEGIAIVPMPFPVAPPGEVN